MASLATSVGAEPSVRFAIDFAEEQPKISDACKNFLAYRIAQAKTDANASPADADRAARLTMLCGRKAMRAVNAAAPATGDAAAAYAAKGDDALATRSFGKSYLRDPVVAAAVRAAPADPAMNGADTEFLEAFLATASDDSDDLTWAPDYQQVLRARDAARRREAARRLDVQEPVDMDPHLAAEAERVHQAVVAASSEGEDGARPLPSLPPLR